MPDLTGHRYLENNHENLRLQVSPRHEPKFKGPNGTLEWSESNCQEECIVLRHKWWINDFNPLFCDDLP